MIALPVLSTSVIAVARGSAPCLCLLLLLSVSDEEEEEEVGEEVKDLKMVLWMASASSCVWLH